MNYNEAVEYIHSVSWTFCKPGLERISELCRRLGDPQKGLRFIHVAGTNGKGSVCAMLSSILRESGYKTGTFTSPYIRFFNERMMINGEPIKDGELIELVERVRPIVDDMADKPTEFELITAIGFEYFKRNSCDVVVLEVGMGGRLDSTNIIDTSELSVITGIALDHTAYLGDTVEKIAAEKAGIIKRGVPVLFGGRDISAQRVICDAADKLESKLFCVDHSLLHIRRTELDGTLFDFGSRRELFISLLGTYQPENASTVLCAVDILRDRGFCISEQNIREGLKHALWHGRFEKLRDSPTVIFDGAHNPQGVDVAVESIKKYFGDKKVCILTGVLSDKDYMHIARRISEVACQAFVITPDSPRALAAEHYAEVLRGLGVTSTSFENIGDAYAAAVESAERESTALCCLGSLYIYSELMDHVENK